MELTAVSATALRVAAVRARESTRPDRLFDDPYAAAFAAAANTAGPVDGTGPAGPGGAESVSGEDLGEVKRVRQLLALHVVVRTRFYDDYLLAAGCRQVVLLAAGLDARAFRLPWPADTYVFELDLPEVLAVKDRVLAAQAARPMCTRTTVAVDLREDWPSALLAAGFEPGEPTAWLIEGLLVYLTTEHATALLTAVRALSAAGSRLATEGTGVAHIARTRQTVTELWHGGLDDPPGWLARHGWHTEVHEFADLAATYGRPLPGPAASGFVTATAVDS
jgi:methyltransferase (TIGR00027 family)